MFRKDFEVITIRENELYNIMVYDNGDEFIHYDVDEIEMLSLTENYKANGFLNKVEEANHESL
jgi:hypothetical protein